MIMQWQYPDFEDVEASLTKDEQSLCLEFGDVTIYLPIEVARKLPELIEKAAERPEILYGISTSDKEPKVRCLTV